MSEGIPSVHADGELVVFRDDRTCVVYFTCARCGRHWKASDTPVEDPKQLSKLPPDSFKCWSCDVVPVLSDVPEAC